MAQGGAGTNRATPEEGFDDDRFGKQGETLPETEVRLSLRRHAFGFGSAVVANRFSGESDDDQRYREIVDKLFSIVVFENDLKDGNWSPDFPEGRRARRNAESRKKPSPGSRSGTFRFADIT